ncbi:hypothetical protein RZS08_01260, partial [Arthrospira platensis SPKY1]|nr:hypothetical protein [Arthrospira platensis SPKY1]
MGHGLQQNGGLADARITPDQYHRAFHQAATQHPIQLAGTAGYARLFHQRHFRHCGHGAGLAGPAGLRTFAGTGAHTAIG